MDDKLIVMKDRLLELYGLDINEAKVFFSTQNYAFIFQDKPNMIRVSIGSAKTRQETMSEVLWVDDLKQFSESICEPSPSLNQRLIEEFSIDGIQYKAAMFRTARGKMREVSKIDPMYFIAVGDMIGRIHAASKNAAESGLVYKRRNWIDARRRTYDKAATVLPAEIAAMAENMIQEIDTLPKSSDLYGMIHGDFHANNFFVENNNIWVFDFDDCCYGYYLYDIASCCHSWLASGYKPEMSRREALYTHILPYFKIGYELHMPGGEPFWRNLELFLRDRQCVTVCALSTIEKTGFSAQMDSLRSAMQIPLLFEDILQGIDEQLKAFSLASMTFQVKDVAADAFDLVVDGGVTTIPVSGRLTAQNAQDLENRVRQLIAENCPAVVMDMKDLLYISSAGIRVVLYAYKNIPKLSITNLSESVRETFDMVGLLSRMEE